MRWRMVGRVAVAVLVGLVVAGVVGAVGIAGARAAVYTPRGPSAPPVPVDSVAVPVHDPGKPTAAIVLGPEGANDPQPPYDAGHPSKASKTVIDHAKTLLRRQAFNPSELRAIPTIAWQRALTKFRTRKGLA
jgi:hypothetical protein